MVSIFTLNEYELKLIPFELIEQYTWDVLKFSYMNKQTIKCDNSGKLYN